MAKGILYVEKIYGGKKWENSYAFATDGDVFSTLNDASLDDIGMNADFTSLTTNVDDSGYDEATSTLVQSIIAFERKMHAPFITINKVYASDGLKNSSITDIGPLHSVFAVRTVGKAGLQTGLPSDFSPGVVALRAIKSPLGYSVKSSGNYYHGILTDNFVAMQGIEVTGWTSPDMQAVMLASWNSALATSGLDKFIGDSENPVFIGIGKHYNYTLSPVDKGDLQSVARLASFAPDQPVGRQMRRGKRRSA